MSPSSHGSTGSLARDVLAYAVLFALVAVGVAWPYLAGHWALAFSDAGGDLLYQYYPLDLEHSRQFAQGGGITWSFRLGLGGYIGTHFDPFMWLQAVFPESWQLKLRIWTYLLKLGLAGLAMVAYLRMIGLHGLPVVLGGLAFAFSDYALINGQWDIHSTELVHFIFLACLLEWFLRSGSVIPGLLIGLMLGFGHPFNMFTSAFFTILYVLARTFVLWDWGSWRKIALRMPLLLLCVVIGILVFAPVQFTLLYYFLDSPRVSGDHVLFSRILESMFMLNDFHTVKSSLMGFLGKNSMGVSNYYTGWANWLEGPGFYVGLPMLLLSTQLAGLRSSPAARRLFWLSAVGIGLYILIPGFRYAVYGFNHVVFRTSTLWISMLLVVIGALGLSRALRRGLDRVALGAAVALLVAFILAAHWLRFTENVAYLLQVLAVMVAYVTIIVVPGMAPSLRFAVPMLAIFVLELMLLARPSLMQRAPALITAPVLVGNYADGSAEAAAWIRENEGVDTFYRIEKDYMSEFLLDGVVQDYNGIRSYFFHAASITRFIDSLGWPRLTTHSNYIDADTSRDDILDLLGVRYLLSKSRERDQNERYRHLATVSGIEIYERVTARSIARLLTRTVPESQGRGLGTSERDRLLLEVALVEDGVGIGNMELPADGEEPRDVALRKLSDTHLAGEYAAEGSRLLALAIPYDGGWSLLLDGRENIPLVRINYGLMGAVVPGGEHRFELRFAPPGRSPGLAVAPFALLAGAALVVLQMRWRRKAAVRHDPARPS